MARIDYSSIKVTDNIPKIPTKEQQKALEEIDRIIARFIIREILNKNNKYL